MKAGAKVIGLSVPPWKYCIDLACCVIALPLLLGLTLVMTIVTRNFAPGPVFFRQERVGCRGRRFHLYKFRTMFVGADTMCQQHHFKALVARNAPMGKMDLKGDRRLIPGSRLLRASGLDELPQIINVLRGEMSIVGPRPCLPTECDAYRSIQRQRFKAMPGITGLWQVSGKNRTTFDEMVRLDLRYVETKSWRLDVKIILLTVPVLVGQLCELRFRRPVTKSAALA